MWADQDESEDIYTLKYLIQVTFSIIPESELIGYTVTSAVAHYAQIFIGKLEGLILCGISNLVDCC